MDDDTTNGSIQKPKVFISYAHEDQRAAERLYRDLKKMGLEPWLDKLKLLPGQNWEIEIKNAIKDSRYFIPLFSVTSVSKIGFVQNEFKTALDYFKQFPPGTIFAIPVRLNDCKIPYEELKSIHRVDLFPNWKEGIDNIEKAIAKNLGPRNPTHNSRRIIILIMILGAASFVIVAAIFLFPSPITFNTYENSAYGIKMEYPYNWIKNITNRSVTFYSPEENSKKFHVAEVRLGAINYNSSLTPTLDNQLKGEANLYQGWSNFQAVETTSNSSLGGHRAYKLVFSYIGSSGIDRKAIDIGTFIDSRLYYIFSITDADKYPEYLPIIKKMVDSFVVTKQA